jgi:hypothetical protein
MCLTLNLKSFIFTKVENETFPLSSTPYYTACIVNFEEGAVWIWKWHLLRLIPCRDSNHYRRAIVVGLNDAPVFYLNGAIWTWFIINRR